MKNIREFKHKIQFLFTDIDDTLTDEGRLGPQAYEALWKLHQAGIHVIPVTGRPAGWCEMIARVWPVSGVIGENGGLYYRYKNHKMLRHYSIDSNSRSENRRRLQQIEKEILQQVPGCAIASDQFCRILDLAVDYCEDVPRLPKSSVKKIVDVFQKHGAQAKVSSIHVNGWFGSYDKLSESLFFLKEEFAVDAAKAKQICAFVGDSPNDEPMWGFFPIGLAVANIAEFAQDLKSQPAYVANFRGGQGFAEITEKILTSLSPD